MDYKLTVKYNKLNYDNEADSSVMTTGFELACNYFRAMVKQNAYEITKITFKADGKLNSYYNKLITDYIMGKTNTNPINFQN